MSIALCDPEAFYPFRSLIQGPLNDPADLPKIERFVRSVVLHDEVTLILEPWPDPEDPREWTPEEIAAGGRNEIISIGPEIDLYEQHGILHYQRRTVLNSVELCPELIHLAQHQANAIEGLYFDARIEYLRTLMAIVRSDGSLVCESPSVSTVINVVSHVPAELFSQLDGEWGQVMRDMQQGDVGLVVPPFLSILLNRCARRDAIPQVLADMKNEFADARQSIWELINALRLSRSVSEFTAAKKELKRVAELMLPTQDWPTLLPVRALWQVAFSALAGAVVGGFAGGHPATGAASAAVVQTARNANLDFREIFKRGAFDLARRVNAGLQDVPKTSELLSRFLTHSEREHLGIA